MTSYLTLEDRGFRVQVIEHSITAEGQELLTVVARYPRFIHSEVMTHRDFSRNAASSRAIPVKKIIDQVRSDPAMPVFWGKNQPGMQAAEELDNITDDFCLQEDRQIRFTRKQAVRHHWLQGKDEAVRRAEAMSALGLHKQIANRILEPWMWMTTIITATNWSNAFKLRRAKDAQPEIKVLFDLIWRAKKRSKPKLLQDGEWHLPFVTKLEKHDHMLRLVSAIGDGYQIGQPPFWNLLQKLSVARCARVSYLNHDGTNPDIEKDLDLHDRLIEAPHASPFEHQATPMLGRHANFVGYKQYRSMIANEYHSTYDGEPEDDER
jgi:thymidylate synthase ThyX